MKYVVAPGVIRGRIETAAARRWLGAVAIKRVRFHYFGPVRLEDLVLTDEQGRRWAEADEVEVLLRGWLAFNPLPCHVEANQVRINACLDNGRLAPPLNGGGGADVDHGRDARAAGAAPLPARLTNVAIQNLRATVSDGARSLTVLGGSAVLVECRHDYYEVMVNEKTDAVWRELSVGGRIRRADGDCALHVEARRVFAPAEGAFLIRLWNGPAQWSAGGLLEVNGTVAGPPPRPAELTARGTARFADWSVRSGQRAIVKHFGMRVRAQGRRYEAMDLACTVYDGRAQGTLWAAVNPGPLAFGGDLTADGVSMKELTVEIGAGEKVSQGTASGRLEFAMRGGVDSLRGRGTLLFDDTSLSMFPLSSKILEGMGFGVVDPLQASDMACVFSLSGPRATIDAGRFVNALAAIETQPGGTVNAETGEVDLHVLAVSRRAGIEDVARKMPLAQLLVQLKKDLLRLHVKGCCWDPPSTLITREPVKDVSEDTLNFMKDAIGLPGASGGDIFGGVGGLPEASPAK